MLFGVRVEIVWKRSCSLEDDTADDPLWVSRSAATLANEVEGYCTVSAAARG
jgi:hypothetical protein